MNGHESVQAAESDHTPLTAGTEPLIDALHAELMRHHLSRGGRNLGLYRTAWLCECGYELVTDVLRGVSLRFAWSEHLSRVASTVFPPGASS